MQMMLKKLLCLAIFLIAVAGFSSLWSQQLFRAASKSPVPQAKEWMHPKSRVLFHFDEQKFSAKKKDLLKIDLPDPDGHMQRFLCRENELLPRSLKNKYDFNSWDIRNPKTGATGKMDWTARGLRVQIYHTGGNYYLEPLLKDGTKNWVQVFSEKDLASRHGFHCHNQHSKLEERANKSSDGTFGRNRRIFDLAIAATGEYTKFYGGTVQDGLSGVVTTVNRANQIFEREMATTFRLVADNDLIVFTDPDTDPFTNGNLNQMLSENQETVNQIIGSANYDVGHVFGTVGGGLARVNSICGSFTKARAATALSFPQGDVFNVDYFCHELGHQFGATHTFNNCSGSWGGLTAFEPGSGSSIMSYAGICGSTNVQMASNRFFHVGSIEQMANTGTGCAVIQNPGNEAPQCFILTPDGLTLPINTPFYLEGKGEDEENEALIYSWDQMDVSALEPYGEPNQNGPLFRHLAADSSGALRFFPSLKNIVFGGSPDEVLPDRDRQVNFNFTARDQHPGGGALDFKSIRLNFTDQAGPFQLLHPTENGLSFEEGNLMEVRWDVAETDQAPVDCQLVNILLSVDGGFTYPFTLQELTPNDGVAMVALPLAQSPSCRIMVQAADNAFFNVSEHNFEIGENLLPELILDFRDSIFFVCNENNLDIDFNVLGINGYRNPTTLRLENMPPFLNYSFNPQGVFTPDRNVELNISGLRNLPGGTYNFKVVAESTDGNFSLEKLLKIRIRRNVPPTVDFSAPENFSNLNQEFFTLEWPQRANTDHFHLQLSRNEDFSELILDTLLPGNQTNFTQVTQSFSAYYCRIRSENACAVSSYSPVLHLRSRSAFCRNYKLEGEWPIQSGSAQTLTFETQVSESFTVTQAELLNIRGEHENTGILEFNLVYPDNSRRILLSFPCPGEKEYLFGVSSRQSTPLSCPLNRGLIYQGEANLAGPLPQNSNGSWALEIINNDRSTGGVFYGYEINLCGDAINRSNEIEEEANEPLQVFTGKSGLIVEQLLLYTSSGVRTSDIVIIPETLPSHGELLINGEPLAEGEWFDQQTILNHELVYQHDGSQNLDDDFIFSVLVSELGILENQRFNINIQNNSLDGTAFISQPMKCPNENNAEVKIEARGGLPPYVFGIQGFAYQTDSIFRGLSPGDYVFTLEDQSGVEIALPIVRIADVPDFELEVEQEARTATLRLTGGTAPYEFSLNGSLFTEDSVFTELGNGSQRLTVKDAKACRETLFFWFEFIPVRGEIINTRTPSCHDSRDGRIAISARNGLPPYRFSIDDGPFDADSIFTDLGPGIYQVKILDALGEIDVLDGIELQNPDPLAVSTNVIDRDIFVNASGGTGQFLYSLNGGNFIINSVFRDVPIGTQQIEVRDQNNCRTTVEVQVTNNPLELDYESLAEINCHGDSTGVIRILAQGGIPPYEFSLNGGPFREGNVFDALPANTYRADVRDSDGRLQTINGIVIEEPDKLELTITVRTDTVIARASGGAAPYEYALDNNSFDNDSLFTGVGPGLHSVRLLDANNCALEKEFSVDASNLNLSLNIVSHPSCFDSENGIIMVNASGGVAPYEYSLDNVEYQQSAVFAGLVSRNYVSYVRDAVGTVGLSNVVRLVSPQPLIASIDVRSDSVLINAFGGTGTILTSLDGSPFDSVYLYHSLDPGEYALRLMDENNCQATYTVEVEAVNNTELSLEDIEIFPNPFHDQFQLRLPNHPDGVDIQVLDALGRVRYHADAKSKLLVVPTRDWTPGVYFIHLKSDSWDQTMIQKMIKG